MSYPIAKSNAEEVTVLVRVAVREAAVQIPSMPKNVDLTTKVESDGTHAVYMSNAIFRCKPDGSVTVTNREGNEAGVPQMGEVPVLTPLSTHTLNLAVIYLLAMEREWLHLNPPKPKPPLPPLNGFDGGLFS